jgi:hypothetical protein
MDTFVIRVWLPMDGGPPDPQGSIRGIVEHVSDGTLMVFDGAEELLGFISKHGTISAQT